MNSELITIISISSRVVVQHGGMSGGGGKI